MIKFFIKSGDPQVSEMFTPYLWGQSGLDKFIEIYLNTEDYGEGLNLLLIKVYVEGRFKIYGPEQLLVENYSKVRKETSAAFTVHRTDFHDKDDDERKSFLTKMVMMVVDNVQLKHEKKLIHYNFRLLKERLSMAAEAYSKQSS